MTTDADPQHRLTRQTVFSPLSDSGRVEEVGQRIASAVHLGLLVDGEQLPSEAELAAQLSVSTVTLREALVNLRAQGLIETRRGRNGGSFIRAGAGTPREALYSRLRRLSAAEWRDIGDEQMAIEAAIAFVAAERATVEDVERLHAVMELLPTATTPASRYRADSRFHLSLAVASQSERLTRSEIRLLGETADVLWMPNPDDELDPETVQNAHAEILAAIEAEDSEKAARLARAHAQAGNRRIRQLHLRALSGDKKRGARRTS
ncbi:FadR/GntR family transcriptional regulator [Mycolicibacterium vaccae]|uniref:FadR/GntR family transcriptional regulator n=1 Tax=Mycolicibacterium vaccae TaxID=1810 RepID=UPI003CF4C0A2